jgi:hypothetical protein
MIMRYLNPGDVIPLTCGHAHTAVFNSPHHTDALFWCDRCDGLRDPAAESEFAPHDIRSWTQDDILLAVCTAGELWLNSSEDPHDVLSDEQLSLLDEAADDYAGEDSGTYRKTDPFLAWSPRALALTLRAAGILWQSTGGADPYDVLSAVQKGRLDRAETLILTADDLARLSPEAPEPGPMGPGTALEIVSRAIDPELRTAEVSTAMNVLRDLAEAALNASDAL